MSSYGKVLPTFYDAFMGDESRIILPLKQLLKKHNVKPKKVLEIGCGTGTILASFPKTTRLFGLDLSQEMLKRAKKKLPQATFYHANMADFHLSVSCDLILCMFDAINHLNSWKEWKKTFQHVSEHLTPKGYFIFDINSLERMKYLTKLGVYFGYPMGNNIMLTHNTYTKKKNTFAISFKMFLKGKGNTYNIIDEDVLETGFPVEKIKKGLQKYFAIEEQFDVVMEKSNLNSKRIFFVCRKK